MIDNVKAYWDKRPCNLYHSAAPIGSRQYFDEVEARKYFVEPHIPEFADFWGNRDKKVLEIGSGLSTDTVNFARMGCRVTAVDLSEKSIELAKQRAKIYSLQDWITFYQGNAEELSSFVPVESYDLIYAFGSIHHSPNPQAIIKELTKYTKRGTILKFMFYNKYSFKVAWMLWTKGYSKNFIAKFSEAEFGCPVTHVYSKKEARELLKDFKILDLHVDHIFPYEIDAYRCYEYRKVWYFRYVPEKWFRWLEKQIGWQMLVTAVVE
jgi:2-polyprenyl-3-methyl-5-hydroxy-6-metoxy-1,4-benzoquinol methylase